MGGAGEGGNSHRSGKGRKDYSGDICKIWSTQQSDQQMEEAGDSGDTGDIFWKASA